MIIFKGADQDTSIAKGTTRNLHVPPGTTDIIFDVDGRRSWYDAKLHGIKYIFDNVPDLTIKVNVAFYQKQGYYNKIIMDGGWWFHRTDIGNVHCFTYATKPVDSIIFQMTDYNFDLFDEWNGSVEKSHTVFPKPPYGWFTPNDY